jgi:hypothetical protein
MNNWESFIARWSRRKQAAAGPKKSDAPVAFSVAALEDASGNEQTTRREHLAEDHRVPAADVPNSGEPVFDLRSVPPIESIGANTDIRGFLAPGVPSELSRVALRRAWVADPTIRDFVGIADYDWDFNAPDSHGGFGPLEMTDDLRRVVAQILGPSLGADQTAETLNAGSAQAVSDQGAVGPDVTAAGRCPEPAHVGGAQKAAPKEG